jgi:hypothetical protein
VVEHLLSKLEALSTTPLSPIKKKTKKLSGTYQDLIHSN